MTFASLEKLIREETRRVVENLERSFSLYEEDGETPAEPATTDAPAETPASETPAEPAKEDKPEDKPEEKPAEEPKTEDKPEETSDETSSDDKKSDDKKDDTTEKPAEETKEPNEEKTGLKTVGFLDKVKAEKLEKKSSLLYPESREKLLDYDFEEALDVYDSVIGEKKDLKKLYKRIEMIATSKHSLLSDGDLDKQTIVALQHYYTNSEKINNIIRFSQPSVSKKEIEIQMKLGKPKEGDAREKKYNSAMNAFTIYELDYAFSEEPQRLKNNVLSYRSVENENILQMFIDAGQWIDKTFVTTSLNPLICEGGDKKRMPLFEFFIPAGTSILTLPCGINDYCHETEVTLPRNCRYTIQGFNETRNIYKILVEQIYGR
jgi:hypothetical protein